MLEPQSTDFIDEFGKRSCREPCPKDRVVVNDPPKATQGSARQSLLVEERLQLLGYGRVGLRFCPSDAMSTANSSALRRCLCSISAIT